MAAVGDLRKIEVRHKHTRHWLWYITAISFATGALLAASLRTQAKAREGLEDIRGFRVDYLQERLKAAREENQELTQTIRSLYTQLSEYQNTLASGGQVNKLLNRELQKYKVLMGLAELEGPGLVMTLRDSTMRAPTDDPMDVESLIVHDRDLQQIENELRAAGAEAIAMNGQRLVERTAIRCVGPVIHVNNVPIGTPYVITALGDPKVIRSGLTIQGGILKQLTDLQFPVELKTMDKLRIPAYNGSVELKHAHPVQPKEPGGTSEEAEE